MWAQSSPQPSGKQENPNDEVSSEALGGVRVQQREQWTETRSCWKQQLRGISAQGRPKRTPRHEHQQEVNTLLLAALAGEAMR
jgi:hypothetical protein